jgi:stage III sporulation protein AB
VKLISCLAVFAGFSAIGLIIYNRAKLKVRFFDNLLMFCNNLRTEISFSLRPITQIIDSYINTYSPVFGKMLLSYRNITANKNNITREVISAAVWDKVQQNEKETITDFLNNLGRHSVAEEKEKIDTAIQIFTAYKNNAENALKIRASLTLKLLIIMGIAGVILLL